MRTDTVTFTDSGVTATVSITEQDLSDGSVLLTWKDAAGYPGNAHFLVWDTDNGCWEVAHSVHHNDGYTPTLGIAEPGLRSRISLGGAMVR